MLILNKKPTEVVFTLLSGVFLIAKCCPILLVVVGSDQDTVRFSVCECVNFSCWQRKREGEREK